MKAGVAALAGAMVAIFVSLGVVLTRGGNDDKETSGRPVGIDVSAHQGAIDWARVKAAGVAFAYIKASEGGDFADPTFARNWEAAGEAGVPRGAYHFFTLCRPGLVQARYFLSVAPREAGSLVPAVDAEHMGPCKRSPQVADPAAELRTFLDTVEARLGARPLIYTTRKFHEAHLSEGFETERFWLRSLHQVPEYGPERWTIWQYDHRGKRDGVNTPVDLNALNGSVEDLMAP